MQITCPCCYARIDIEAAVQDDAARRALQAALSLPPALSRDLIGYIGLFRPRGRGLSWARVATLLDELLAGIRDGRIDRKGRTWRAPHEHWRIALQTVLARRDAGTLALPLSGHGYLYAVLVSLADRAEGAAEASAEQARRARSARAATGDAPRRLRDLIPSDAEAAAAAGRELAALLEQRRTERAGGGSDD